VRFGRQRFVDHRGDHRDDGRAVIDRALEHIRPEKTPTKYDSRAAARPALPS